MTPLTLSVLGDHVKDGYVYRLVPPQPMEQRLMSLKRCDIDDLQFMLPAPSLRIEPTRTP
jgi:hypothetical protein